MQICGICGGYHDPINCDIVQVVSHIPDKVIPSKAKLTLPEDLELKLMADGSYNIAAAYPLGKGTQFGPLQAQKLCTLLPDISFPIKIFNRTEENFSEYYLDTTSEAECNWMMFISPATDFQEQNIICYQEGEDIYFVTIRDICEGEFLKVWYSPYYATKMQKDVLNPKITKNSIDIKSNDNVDILIKNKKGITSREMWNCKFCGKIEKSVSQFALHLLTHYEKNPQKYCKLCNISFYKMNTYQNHMKYFHEPDIKKTPLPTQTNALSHNLTKNHTDQSSQKENYFGGPLLLNELLSDSMDNMLPNTDMNNLDLSAIENQTNLFENENLNLNMDSILSENVKDLDNFNFELVESDNEQFVCDICLKTFKKWQSFKTHLNVHTGKYSCFECKKVFARKENFDNHSCKLFYKIKCSECEKIFYQKKYLVQHIKFSHRNYCKSCKQIFDTKELLDQHTCSNLINNITFSCNVCLKTFTDKNNLITHRKIHEKTGEEEEYCCIICNKLFASKKTYDKHYRLHSGYEYKCNICDKIFKRQDMLKYHLMNIHTSNREICPVCNKEIKSKKLLKHHMKIHKGQTFKCPKCPKVYTQAQNFNRHFKNSHDQNRNVQQLLSNMEKCYSCPECDKKIKTMNSLKRHLHNFHPESKMSYKSISIKKTKQKKQFDFLKEVDDSVLDLKQTIETLNFNTDEINREITIEIDKLLNNPDNFGSDSNDRLVESLINTAVRDNNLENRNHEKDALLSMPDLDVDLTYRNHLIK